MTRIGKKDIVRNILGKVKDSKWMKKEEYCILMDAFPFLIVFDKAKEGLHLSHRCGHYKVYKLILIFS